MEASPCNAAPSMAGPCSGAGGSNGRGIGEAQKAHCLGIIGGADVGGLGDGEAAVQAGVNGLRGFEADAGQIGDCFGHAADLRRG